MKKLLAIFGLALSLFFTQCANPESIDKKALKVVSQFNSKCPLMIDAETRMDGIEVKGENTIKYKYTLINLNVEKVDTSKFNTALRPGIISTIKTDSELAELRRINCSFEYYYKDRDGNFIYSFVITPNDYNN
jgi:hypothetical protein